MRDAIDWIRNAKELGKEWREPLQKGVGGLEAEQSNTNPNSKAHVKHSKHTATKREENEQEAGKHLDADAEMLVYRQRFCPNRRNHL